MEPIKTYQLAGVVIPIYVNSNGEYYTEDFQPREFRCRCRVCERKAEHPFNELMVARAQAVRRFLDRPVVITSAHRCSNHPIESKKIKKRGHGGTHWSATGLDFAVRNGCEAFDLIEFGIIELACRGFSYNEKKGFVHLDWDITRPRRTWSYG